MTLLLAVVAVTFPYIGLGVGVDLGPWHADAPLADWAAAALLPLGLWAARRQGWSPPGARAYGALLLVGWVSAWLGPAPLPALHELVRKTAFCGVAYGVGVAAAVRALPSTDRLRGALLLGVATCALVSLATSVGRIAAGDTLWFQSIEGLTNNHKTLAVALAPTLPLLWATGDDRTTRRVVGLAAVAIVASLSRTAWIALAAGSVFLVQVGGRPLSSRRWILPAVVVGGFALATYAPLLTGSLAQLDALRSRQSLDKRAWMLFAENPVFGASPGASVRHEMQTFPDYRVNHVEAHGVVQKVGAEYGILGLGAYAAAVGSVGRMVYQSPQAAQLWPAFVALHVNLLLSTEAFTQTHWAVLGIVVGLAAR